MNPWARFQNLLPKVPRLVGDIIAVSSGTYTVQLPTGGEVQARSQASFSIGQRVFVRDGVIESEAPALTPLTIEV